MGFPAFEKLAARACAAHLPGVELKAIFETACASRADVGSGWDLAAAGQMTFWQFTEGMLLLAERAKGAGEVGLAPALARLVGAMQA